MTTPLPQDNALTTLPTETKSASANASMGTPVIPMEVLAKYGIAEDLAVQHAVLIDLILKSESMKEDERVYWFQLLPVMDAEQIEKLRGILQGERDQLAAIDAKYEKEMAAIEENKGFEETILKAKQERVAREMAEKEHRAHEENAADDLLAKMNAL